MDLRQRLIAPFATVSFPGEIVSVDLQAFVIRLILFDQYVVQSVRFQEFPELIRAFGFPAVRELLGSNAIKVRCETLTIAQVGQLTLMNERIRKGTLSFGSYSFSVMTSANHHEYIHTCLQSLHSIAGLRHNNIVKLKQDITSKLLPPSATVGYDMMRQLHEDLRSNHPILKKSISLALGQKIGRDVKPEEFAFSVHQIDEGDYRTETNIGALYGKSAEETHRIMESGLIAVGGLNQRIGEMKEFNALSGFQSADLPLFEEKVDFITRQFSPDAQVERVRRIFLLKGFDDLDELIARREIDLSKLLKIRETPECKEFRQWLSTIDSASDAELQDRIRSLREKLSWAVHSKSGKVARWLASAGIGSIPVLGPIAGVAIGFLDTFLMDKLLPKPGPITFLNRQFPSIFRS